MSPGQRPPWTDPSDRDPLDRDPPPWTETQPPGQRPWAETRSPLMDRDQQPL